GISSGIVICAFVISDPCSADPGCIFAMILSLLIPPDLAAITAIPNEATIAKSCTDTLHV
ncbi:MAG TPA: hypothetical protein VMN99_04040, partial [Anaerolineales bacterium]|nr:hypothetical protein [Anaerolineales bacterium]